MFQHTNPRGGTKFTQGGVGRCRRFRPCAPRLVGLQRTDGRGGRANIVVEGRDIGTVASCRTPPGEDLLGRPPQKDQTRAQRRQRPERRVGVLADDYAGCAGPTCGRRDHLDSNGGAVSPTTRRRRNGGGLSTHQRHDRGPRVIAHLLEVGQTTKRGGVVTQDGTWTDEKRVGRLDRFRP